ncbi:nucleotidyl transferase AbiEii/AbiGii toxin family protein [Bacillus sp. V59.32b]|uniref:nucleotidyl transferase AbiEii/AbiGii toxin family protein n=1 Tax=Bacillus sp. V59.32b TaxID=1758642 RepID=UPI000E3E2773|nr:nucleotidyl transferase AbiEii/AbiGii toxin family protein [Bacillus sp. V59.32b]RFU66799.1 nucleotidyl transferase AbiEii/AbiGii toxin family protein [Bacillus sp. V59.32b]
MKLHEDEQAFNETIALVAQEKLIPEEQVEKDYFVSVLLQQIVNRAPNIVFKGGTSLSKCFKLINRFSEDIDINFKENANPTQGEMEKLKAGIIAAIDDAKLELTNKDKIGSRRIHNIYEVRYPNLIEPTGAMKNHLMVETFVAYKTFPCEKKMVSNYILDYFIEAGETEIIEKYELAEFEISVQKLDRTFVDKIFAILDYVEVGTIDRNSRHLYDLHMIWKEIGHKLEQESFESLFNAVAKERSTNQNRNVSAQNGYKMVDKLNEIIDKKLYRDDYETITVQLMHKEEDIINYDDVIDSLKAIINSGLIPLTIKLL